LLGTAIIVLAVPAGGRFLLDPRIVCLELARSARAAATVIEAWRGHGTLHLAISSIEWDYAFLIAYGAFLVVASLRLATRRTGIWKVCGIIAAATAVAAAVLDAIENGAMLEMLRGVPTEQLAQRSSSASTAKFALAGLSLAYLILASIFGRSKTAKPHVYGATDDPGPMKPSVGELPFCDLIMKGGITSGIVYPKAIFELSQHYRFRSIGGASAGAIAAGLTAAAELGRKRSGRPGGLDELAALPGWLRESGRMLRLFRPDQETRSLFGLLVAFLDRRPVWKKIPFVIFSALRGFFRWVIIGLLPGVAIAASMHFAGARAGTAFWAIVASLLCVPLAVAGGAARILLRVLPSNGFGICSGAAPAPPGEEPSLTPWLTALLDGLAGIGAARGPLRFGDLWGSAPEATESAAKREINLEVLTNSLTHGRPYRIPFDDAVFSFKPRELRRLFPDRVVDWMVDPITGKPAPESDDAIVRLPEPACLPVVFAIRLSLSFPLLVSAVPLYAEDHTLQKPHPERCWFSDGGIASNFPIHFFDHWLPRWPTFGIDLVPPQQSKVWLPERAGSGIAELWNRFPPTLYGFLGALVNSIHSWMDNRQSRVPGYRDRIVRISLGDGEGGLNIDMPSEVIDELAQRGMVAGRLLTHAFAAPGAHGWENQRWVRFRTLMALLEHNLPELHEALTSKEGKTYEELGKAPEHYKWRGNQPALAAWVIKGLIDLAEQWRMKQAELEADLEHHAPRPTPELRVAPKI
jgi:predicted acylesterase/phospholipase RssA